MPPRQSGRARAVILVAIAAGGVLGALARYGITLALPSNSDQFPAGILIVNLSGSFALGFVLILFLEQFPAGRLARPIVGAGFLGAYTTFSTFAVQAVLLIRADHALTALAYVVASVVGGLAALGMGVVGARLLVRVERWLQEHAG
jgi:fluoride exporter